MDGSEHGDKLANIYSFRQQVRHALAHLYDTDVLFDHPLVHPLGLAQRADRSRALRQLLLDAIQSIRPQPGEPPETPSWQMHQALLLRYVQRMSAGALADQLGMSGRNLRRLQTHAIARLAEVVMQHAATDARPVARRSEAGAEPPIDLRFVDDELAWLRSAPLGEPTTVDQILADALPIVGPVAQQAGVQIMNRVPADLPRVVIHPLGLRQVLLSLLNCALGRAMGGEVMLGASAATEHITLTVDAVPGELGGVRAPTATDLTVAERILAISCDHLERMETSGGGLRLQVRLATASGTEVMVIDDNPDALQLYERYTVGTRYRLTLCQDPQQAAELAVELLPHMIVMDIMMPAVDGWALLSRLRHHPATASLPILICTIVPDRTLALSLGAADFVQKPVTRSAFLAALDRQLPAATPASR